MSSDPAAVVSGWIREGNLRPFVQTISSLVGYALDEDDWTAVRLGVAETFGERGIWYDYPLTGDGPAHIRVARDEPGSSVLLFEVRVPLSLVSKVEMAGAIMQEYDLTR